MNPGASTFRFAEYDTVYITPGAYYTLELQPYSNNVTLHMGTAVGQTFDVTNLSTGNGSETGIVSANTYDPAINVSDDFTINNNATFIASDSSILRVGGDWDNDNGGAFTHNSGTVQFTGTADSRIYGSTNFNVLKCDISGQGYSTGKNLIFDSTGTQTIANLIIKGERGHVVALQSDVADTQANIRVTSSSVEFASVKDMFNAPQGASPAAIRPTRSINLGNNNISGATVGWIFASVEWIGAVNNNWNLAGNWDPGVIPSRYDDVLLSTGDAPVITADRAIFCSNLTINTADASLDLNGHNLTVAGGIDSIGTILNTGGATVTLTANSFTGGTISTSGRLILASAGDVGTAARPVTVTGSTHIDATAAGSGQVSLAGATLNIHDMTGAAGIVTLDGDVALTGTLTLNSDLYVSGDWANNGALTHNGHTVTFNGATDTDITTGGTAAGKGFHNVVIDGAGIKTLKADMQIDDSITINAGAHLKGEGNRIYVAYDWNNYGTYTAGTSEVVFNTTNDTHVRGDTAFNKLTCDMSLATAQKTVYFEAGKTQTIAATGTLTLKGGSQQLKLRSTTDGAKWKIDPQGIKVVEAVDVMDSENIGSTYILPYPTSSRDSGNNIKWFTPRPPDPPDDDDDWVPKDQNYIVDPWTNMYAFRPSGDNINMESEMVNDGRNKYARNYAKGKYKTAVIVFEGKVLVASYNEKKGPNYKTATAVTGGQKTEQKGQIL
jgi:hypothetical protein